MVEPILVRRGSSQPRDSTKRQVFSLGNGVLPAPVDALVRNAADELGKIHGRESRLREASQLRVGGHEAPQGFGPRANDAQSLADVAKDGAILATATLEEFASGRLLG